MSTCCIDATSRARSPVGASGATRGANVVVTAVDVGFWVASVVTVVGVGVGAGVTGALAAGATGSTATSSGVAAASPPSRVGIDRASAQPEISITSTMAAPKARLRAGRAINQRAWRTGSSTNRNESAESPTASATATKRSVQPSGPQRASASTSTGQCHRYSAYECRPNHCRPLTRRVRAGDHRNRVTDPPTMTAIVASTGTRTAVPGHGIDASNRTQAMTITARPHHTSAARMAAGITRT